MPELVWPHHELSVEAHLGPLPLNAALELRAPWTVTFGHSGSGKSSLLRAACGLIPQAKVKFARRTSLARSTKPGSEADTAIADSTIWQALDPLPPHLRGLAYAPQHAALFPHLSARDNIRFPSQVNELAAKESGLIDDVLRLFNIHSLGGSMPVQLSGGERRLVALARAFAVPNCRLMLLDEPFTGLDRALRDELLPRMQMWLAARNIPVLSVTHDVDEALLLNADVIRIADGRVQAQGPAQQVLAAERDRLLKTLG